MASSDTGIVKTNGYADVIADELSLPEGRVRATIELLDGGATVPFITRYRKEATGSLDETVVTAIRDRHRQLRELDERRAVILSSLDERGLLTDELAGRIRDARTMTLLEDIYLPYRPKRRTRATIAREKGLEPLASLIMEQGATDIEGAADAYIDVDAGVMDADDALSGARDIIAEWVSEDVDARERMRKLYRDKGLLVSRLVKGRDVEGAKYRDYFEWEELASKAPSHRVLAMRRGEKEGVLSLRVTVTDDEAAAILRGMFVKGGGAASLQVAAAVEDGYRRLLGPSMETEVRQEMKQRADEEAVRVFAGNVRELLLAPPLGKKRVLAVDPGFRTGCKVCCLDGQGALLEHTTIYPHQSERRADEAVSKLKDLCERHSVDVIAVGNGTAGRETEAFIRGIDFGRNLPVVMVNESGASIYSTSDVARDEFPDLDATVRGTVSIGRRLMDPLAELVKIDPKSIGVGQYQHDVDQQMLKGRLDDVVIACVNTVGVELNTASRQLLSYVSGLGPSLADRIVRYRDEHGPFKARSRLLDVPRLGAKAFEQAAGFLRIRDAANPLDGTAVHPESYHVVESMAGDLGCDVNSLIRREEYRRRLDISRYVHGAIGLPTLNDIMDELARPGRDPRSSFELFAFADGVMSMEDLRPGMKLPGIVTNVTAFGAFVDVGVHQDGLVHISQLADRFVKDPGDIVRVHQRVRVTVLQVDIERRRISLSMRERPDAS